MAMTRKQLARLDGHISKRTGRCDCRMKALACAVFSGDVCMLLSTLMFERLAQEKVTSFVSQGRVQECACAERADMVLWSPGVVRLRRCPGASFVVRPLPPN